MKIALLLSVLLISLVLVNGAFALSVAVTQSGADSDEIMKGRTFTVEASGWTGSCSQATLSFSGCPSCSLSGESTQKTIGSASSVSWTTTSASQSASAQTISVSVSSGCSLQQAGSNSFDIVLPPSLSVTATPDVSSLDEGQTYDVNLNVLNSGETTADDITFDISGDGMSISSGCSSISTLDEGQSAGQSCTITASSDGTIPTILTASSTNADSASDTFSMTVNSLGGGDLPPGSPGGSGTPSGGGGEEPGKNVSSQERLQAGETLRTKTSLQSRFREMLGYEYDLNTLLNNSREVSGSITLTKEFESTSSESKLTLSYSYAHTHKAKNMFIYLNVPKEFASSANNITLTALGSRVEILEEDPEYVLLYPEVDPRTQLTVELVTGSMIGSDVIDSVNSEVYPEFLEVSTTPEEELCTPGETRCFAGDVQECTADQFWKVTEVCEYGCKNSECMTEQGAEGPQFVLPEGLSIELIGGIILVAIIIVAVGIFLSRRKKKPNFRSIPSMGRSPLEVIAK